MQDPIMLDLARYDRDLEEADRWQELTLDIKDYCDQASIALGHSDNLLPPKPKHLRLGRCKDNLEKALERVNEVILGGYYEA